MPVARLAGSASVLRAAVSVAAGISIPSGHRFAFALGVFAFSPVIASVSFVTSMNMMGNCHNRTYFELHYLA